MVGWLDGWLGGWVGWLTGLLSGWLSGWNVWVTFEGRVSWVVGIILTCRCLSNTRRRTM